MASRKYFRVTYDADLFDGRCFRPLTWTVLNDVRTATAAARVVCADTIEEAQMWHGMGCVVTVHRVTEVPAADYVAHVADVRAVIELATFDPGMIQREADLRGVLPTVIAEEWKHAAAQARSIAAGLQSHPLGG